MCFVVVHYVLNYFLLHFQVGEVSEQGIGDKIETLSVNLPERIHDDQIHRQAFRLVFIVLYE